MGLADNLNALKSKSNPDGLCLVGLWRSRLNDTDREAFDTVISDAGISSADILKAVGDEIDFKRTTLTVHRRGECSCQN